MTLQPDGPITNLLQHLAQHAMDKNLLECLVHATPASNMPHAQQKQCTTAHTTLAGVFASFAALQPHKHAAFASFRSHARHKTSLTTRIMHDLHNPDLIYSHRDSMLVPYSSQCYDTAAAGSGHGCHSQL
jgi:hypothetical protein